MGHCNLELYFLVRMQPLVRRSHYVGAYGVVVGAKGDDAVLSVGLYALKEERFNGIFHRSWSIFGGDQVV